MEVSGAIFWSTMPGTLDFGGSLELKHQKTEGSSGKSGTPVRVLDTAFSSENPVGFWGRICRDSGGGSGACVALHPSDLTL